MHFSSQVRRRAILVAAALLVGFILRLLLAPIPSTDDDVYFQTWSHLLVERKAGSIYDFEVNQEAFKEILARSGAANFFAAHKSSPDPYIFCDYPPMFLYLLKAMGHIYKGFFSPTFDETTGLFRALLKLPTILADILIGLTIFILLRRKCPFRISLLAFVFYIFNPVVIYNSAYVGFPEAIQMLFVILSLAALMKKRWALAWSLLTMGIWIKPQTAVFAPLALYATFSEVGFRGLLRPLTVALLISLLVFMPFILQGRADAICTFFRQVSGRSPTIPGVHPKEKVLSMGAFNLWWLGAQGRADLSDDTPLLGPLNTYHIGLGLFLATYSLILYWLHRRKNEINLFQAGVFISVAFFILTTRMTERYLFPVLPLLALLYFQERRFRILYFLLSATFFINLYLVFHFIPIWPWKALGPVNEVSAAALRFSPGLEHGISLAVAYINLFIFIYLLYLLLAGLDLDS